MLDLSRFERKKNQEATSGWNFTKCISEVKVNQLKVKNMHDKMGTSIFKTLQGNQLSKYPIDI